MRLSQEVALESGLKAGGELLWREGILGRGSGVRRAGGWPCTAREQSWPADKGRREDRRGLARQPFECRPREVC